MRVWLELTQEEGERLFEAVKDFTVDRMQTSVIKTNESARENDKPVKLEQIRAILADKSQAGKREEVKELITKYGAEKLTSVDPVKYEELLKEAEAL